MKYFVWPLLLASLIALSACESPKRAAVSKKTSDQNFLAIREEFRAGNWDRTLELIRQSGQLVETNLTDDVLRLRIETLKAIASKLNRESPSSNANAWQKARLAKYAGEDLHLINGKVRYLGRELEQLIDSRSPPDPALLLEYLRLNPLPVSGRRLSDELVGDFRRKADRAEAILKSGKLPARARDEVVLLLRDSYLALSGLASGVTNVDRRYFPALHRAADLVIDGVRDRTAVLNALFLKMYLFNAEGKRTRALETASEIVKKFGSDRMASVVLYWKANESYLKGEAGKAVDLYRKALVHAASLTSADLARNYLSLSEDADHFRQEIVKRLNIVRSEVDYQKALATRTFAVVTGDNVRLRQSMDASTSRNVITSLGTGEKVIFLKRSETRQTVDGYTDWWYFVRLRSGNEGWIFGKYLLVF